MKVRIGGKIKSLRQEQHLSIRDLAAVAEMSPASLSNIEREINSPSIDSLAKICQALGIHMIDLLEDQSQTVHQVVRKDDRKVLSTEGESNIIYEIVSPSMEAFKMIHITMEPLCDYGYEAKNFPHDEICTVLEGQMEIEVGEEEFLLNEGDAIYIKANTHYRYRNMMDQRCVTLWAMQG